MTISKEGEKGVINNLTAKEPAAASVSLEETKERDLRAEVHGQFHAHASFRDTEHFGVRMPQSRPSRHARHAVRHASCIMRHREVVGIELLTRIDHGCGRGSTTPVYISARAAAARLAVSGGISLLLVALPPHSSLEITMSHSALGSNGNLGPAPAFHDRGWYNRDYRLAIDPCFLTQTVR